MIDRIVRDVAQTFEVSPVDIMGPSRNRRICMARWCVMAHLYDKGWNPYRISLGLGMHHTSVYYAMGMLGRDRGQ